MDRLPAWHRTLHSGVALAGVLFGGAAAASGAEPQAPAAAHLPGESLYRVYCENCHGVAARGDGPMAKQLKVKPTDLTRLGHGRETGFPAEELRRVIDGREASREHSGSQMPVWGIAFQVSGQDSNQDREVRTRIDQLVEYLRSIQR